MENRRQCLVSVEVEKLEAYVDRIVPKTRIASRLGSFRRDQCSIYMRLFKFIT